MQPLSTESLEAKGEQLNMVDPHHPLTHQRETVGVYVWQYPLRLFHWGMVISIVALSFTGYYIHDPFIIGQVKYPFLMGWFRFVHETFGMILIALFLLRMALFFQGNSWVGWRRYVPLRIAQWKEMVNVAKFYLFINPRPVARIGHNAMAAFAYVGIYGLMALELITGLVLYTNLGHNGFLRAIVGWIPALINVQNLRLIHFFLMFVFLAFAVFHIHLSMLISKEEKRGLMDSIFIGWKVVPVDELHEEQEETLEILRKAGK
jgi:Ni/Fe-hydrogenase 1 B-type cytochrome subunit